MRDLNVTCAIAWGLIKPVVAPITEVRAELKPHNLYIKWDSGVRRHTQAPRQRGWWLYHGSKRGSGKRQWFHGTFEECCREAVARIHHTDDMRSSVGHAAGAGVQTRGRASLS
jgi:hypothetical protein